MNSGVDISESKLLIQTHGLTKRYRSLVAVDNLSLRVPQGHVFGILGPNGSGKTTTLSMILGLLRPTSGSIRLFEHPSEGVPLQALQRIGAILETPAFYPYLSGRDNLKYIQGIIRTGTRKSVEAVLKTVGLSERADDKYYTYSLGMKQRLGLAYAMLGDPDLLVLDEPTNGLDPAGMVEVRDLIRGLSQSGHTVLLSSHLLHEVEQVCDSVAILSKGRLIAQGSVQELLHEQDAIRLMTTTNGKAMEIISSLPWITGISFDDRHLLIKAPAERSWEIARVLGEQGVYVSEMIPIKASLEQYFLQMTGDIQSEGER